MSQPIRPKAREDLAVLELDGEAVIYDEQDGNVHFLNSTATLIFGLCDGTATIRQLSGDLADVFGRPLDEIESQVRSLLRRLRRAGLLDGHVGRARG